MQKIKEIRVEEVHNIEEKEHFFRVYFAYAFMAFFLHAAKFLQTRFSSL